MPGKKRARWEGELDPAEEGELHKRNKGGDQLDLQNGESQMQRPSSRASDKMKSNVPACKNGHELVLVSKEVRRLEKETPWTCDNTSCSHCWESECDSYMDRQRFRCVHHTSGNAGCNYDLCGDCYHSAKDGEEPRRSSREIKPKFKTGHEGEWVISPKFQSKTSPDKYSPKSVYSENNMVNGDSTLRSKSPPVSPRTRHTRSQQQRSRSPPTAAGRSPRARSRGEEKDPDTESDFEEDTRRSKIREESPFYPTGVRFSPSVKNGGSPYGRRTRSGGRSRNMTSYLQSLASEDEQNEFNRQYSRDLRKRQARKLSEEGQEERRSTRLRSGDTKSEDHSADRRGRRVRVELDHLEEIEDEESTRRRSSRGRRTRIDLDQFDEDTEEGETNTRRSLRSRHSEPEENHQDRSRRRRSRPISVSEDDRPLASRRRRNQGSNAEDQSDDEAARPSRRRRNLRSNEEDHSEEETAVSSRRRHNLRTKVVDHSEDEDEGDPTVTEASVRRSSRRRVRTQVGVDAEDADTESGAEKQEEEEEGEEETEETEDSGEETRDKGGDQEQRRSSRRNRNPVNRFSYDAPPQEIIRGRRSTTLENLDKYGTDEEFNGGASPKKKKYSLRTVRANTNRYQAEINGDVSTKDRGLIRRSAMSESGTGRSRRPRERKKSRRNRTGDSSSPTSSSCSDQEAFERRKSKRMLIEREKLRPLNMNTKDVTKSIFKERSKIGASLADVQPMEMDSGVTFDSIGGLKEYVNALKEMVMFPLLYPELFDQFKIVPPRGVLFYGPPGTGKTLLARALANECSSENRKVAFFMRKGADCLSKWIGESERQLRLLFDQAYQMRPSIIFFDEIDGLAPVRSSRQDQIHSSIVSTLLALMDGLDNRGEIIVIGATNRIENIDPALRRPGRFDRELRFSLPCKSTRKEILKLHTKHWNPPVTDQLMNLLSARTLGYCGADIKGLCTEAALNALRRRYPQVYESSQKLQIDLQQIEVIREDFDKALRKIVPSTHRVEDKVLSPLPRHIKPLLETTHQNLVANIKRMFPHSAVGKGAVLPKTLTHRPRLMIVGSEGQGQNTYVGPALLHFLEKFPCQKLDIPALFSNSARTPEEACTQIIHSARRTMPGVLYIPHLCMLWDTISDTVRATLTTLLRDIPPTAPLLILALCNRPYSTLAPEVQSMFLPFHRELFKLENPTENERREYFRPLFVSCTNDPPKPKKAPPPVEALPVLPAPETRKLTEREEKRLRKKEEALLRELRIFLRDIWAKINRESKFFMFRSPVNTEEVDDYLEYVKNPMDFEKMHQKLDDGEYQCAKDFLDDIDLIASNATAYNCDLAYETNRIICHRARALQDFAYALVKAEMDTDFEDECKNIVERRDNLTKKLKKMDKEKPVEVNPSPSKMQELMAIVELACKVCNKTSDDSNMLICDGCDEGYHTYCIVPRIKEVPDGDWFCPKCCETGVDKMNDTASGVEHGSAEAGGSGGTTKKRQRRRRSKWSSGVLKKRTVKKKILDSDDENADKKNEEQKEEKDEEEDKEDQGDEDKGEMEDNEDKGDKGEVEEDIDKKEDETEDDPKDEEAVDENGNQENEKEKVEDDEMEVSPRISRSASLRNKSKDGTETLDLSSTPRTRHQQVAASLPDLADTTNNQQKDEEEKVVKVDLAKLGELHEHLVSVTEGLVVEALERAYANLAKVVRKYRSQYDRTNLTDDLEAQIDQIKQIENSEDDCETVNVSNTSSRKSPRK